MVTFPHDMNTGVALVDLAPTTKRAGSWFARAAAANRWGEEDLIRYGGAVHMICGMQYHFDNFSRNLEFLKDYYKAQHQCAFAFLSGRTEALPTFTPEQQCSEAALQHEVLAYVNRMGQFVTFAKSLGFEPLMPICCELMVFRNKFAAHRSLDAPRGEPLATRVSHATSFGWHQVIEGSTPVYQILDRGGLHQLNLLQDHEAIMAECYAVLETIASPV